MHDSPFNGSLLQSRLRSISRSLFWLGLTMLVLGAAAIAWPAVSSLVVTLFVGWMLLAFGFVALCAAFVIHGTGPFFGAFLLAGFSVSAGLYLLMNPLAAEAVLTLILAAIFMIQGAFEAAFAFEVRPVPGWLAMLVSAIVTIVLGFLIVVTWPQISLFLLGIMLGINFISTGLGYILISRAMKLPS